MKTFKVTDYFANNTSNRKLHPAGYLLLPKCPIARSGILEYSDVIDVDGNLINDGNPIKVYRPPEAIKKCLQYYNNLPMSITHPPERAISPETVREVVVGTTSGNAIIEDLADGEVQVVVDIMIHDKDTIKLLQDGKYQELSAGYETAYKRDRGVTNNRVAYDAVQFYLMPNHVALVENGRCGSECRICDHKENIISKGAIMKLVRVNDEKPFRYFLRSDSNENDVIELSQEAFDELSKAKDTQVEELDEKDVQFEDEKKTDEEYMSEDQEEVEEEEVDVPGIEDEEVPPSEPDVEGEEVEVEEEPESEIFEVELEDGVIGKMDKAAYDYFKRYMEMQKKGDEMENAVEMMSLAAVGERVLGKDFKVDSYIADGKFDSKSLKKAVIKKQLPNIVVDSLKNEDALNSMFNCAIDSSKKKVVDWKADMVKLSEFSTKKIDNKEMMNPVEKARQNRLNIINKVKENK